MAHSLLDTVATLAGLDPGRGIGPLQSDVQRAEALRRSASEIASRSKTFLVTGFPIPSASPVAAETDGPLGTAALASFLAQVGYDVSVVTDHICAPVVRAALNPPSDPSVELVELKSESELSTWIAQANLESASTIYIERPGPTANGDYRTMSGREIAGITALERLAPASGFTVGIGDGGNEVGMGTVPFAVIAAAIPSGAEIACSTPTDELIVSGTSNWGAFALVAALGMREAHWTEVAGAVLQEAWLRDVLRSMISAGAVDGVTAVVGESVDDVPWALFSAVPSAMRRTILGSIG